MKRERTRKRPVEIKEMGKVRTLGVVGEIRTLGVVGERKQMGYGLWWVNNSD